MPGLMKIQSLTSTALIVNEMISDFNLDVLCLTETWLKPNDYIYFKWVHPTRLLL